MLKKCKEHLNPGYVWAPYIIATSAPEILESSFNPKIKSRYGVGIETIQQKRSKKIRNILENVNV
jgi:hypothetical protein